MVTLYICVQVHLMRHDMLNFITVTQNYVKNMVLDVTWEEFQVSQSNYRLTG